MGILIKKGWAKNLTDIQIDITNWRYLRDSIDDKNKKKTLIILNNCRVYLLYDVPIEFIYRVNRLNSTVYILTAFYIKSVLWCEKCNGLGKIDWVENICGVRDDISYEKYERDSKNLIKKIKAKSNFKIVPEIFFNGEYLLSSAKLEEGVKHCDKCLGSGLRLPEDIKVVEEFKERKLNEYM